MKANPISLSDGTLVRFTRRRYSNRTFTWVSAFLDGKWVELGDPWPSVKVSEIEIRAAIAREYDVDRDHESYQEGS